MLLLLLLLLLPAHARAAMEAAAGRALTKGDMWDEQVR